MLDRGTARGLQLRTALAVAALAAALLGTVGAASPLRSGVGTVFTPMESWNSTGAVVPPPPHQRFLMTLP